MRRRVLALIAALVVLGSSPVPAAHAVRHPHGWAVRHVAFEMMDHRSGYNYAETTRTIWVMTRRFPIPGGYAMAICIGHRESGASLDPFADNPHSSATGVFQIVDGTWASMYRGTPDWVRWLDVGYDRRDARNNIILAIITMHRYGLGGWGGGCG